MREVYFETETAIIQFSYDNVVERLPYYESGIGTAEAPALRNPYRGLLESLFKSLRI
jgi:hypothetical protein